MLTRKEAATTLFSDALLDAPVERGSRDHWLRKQSCCASEPRCQTCPLRPENEGRSLRELAEAALLGEERGPGGA